MPNASEGRFLAIKVRMMPRETNPHGTIFGGVLLSYIDQAGAIGASHGVRRDDQPEPSLVTVAMDSVEFHQPVYVGDVVSFWSNVVRIGRTSITVHVTVDTERNNHVVTLTEADVTFVAVDLTDGPPRPIPIQSEP